LRDKADPYRDVDCVVLGASFDTPAENKAFAEKENFGFRLLSDVDRSVGSAYHAVRGPDEKYPEFAKRVSYLIDPAGVIRQAYEVTDPGGHADQVLADLARLRG
jgi:peroxiredoxin Q/BCP